MNGPISAGDALVKAEFSSSSKSNVANSRSGRRSLPRADADDDEILAEHRHRSRGDDQEPGLRRDLRPSDSSSADELAAPESQPFGSSEQGTAQVEGEDPAGSPGARPAQSSGEGEGKGQRNVERRQSVVEERRRSPTSPVFGHVQREPERLLPRHDHRATATNQIERNPTGKSSRGQLNTKTKISIRFVLMRKRR